MVFVLNLDTVECKDCFNKKMHFHSRTKSRSTKIQTDVDLKLLISLVLESVLTLSHISPHGRFWASQFFSVSFPCGSNGFDLVLPDRFRGAFFLLSNCSSTCFEN